MICRLMTLFALASSFIFVQSSMHELHAETLTADGFTLDIPDDWDVIDEEKTMFTVRAPLDEATDKFGENIRVIRHAVGRSFTVEQVLTRQKSDTGRFKLIDEGKVEGSKVPMVWMAITPTAPRDVADQLIKIDFIATSGTDIIVMSAMSEPDVWKSYMPKFKNIVSTFAPIPDNKP